MKISHPTTASDLALRALGGEVEFFSSGGIEAKVYGLPAMTKIEQHVHTYDHMSILISGKATLVADKVVTEHTGPAFLELKAGVKHTVIAEEATLWACIHNMDRIDV